MNGHDPDDAGDDADGAHDDAGGDRPDGWPDDWTTADDDVHAPGSEGPTADPNDTDAPPERSTGRETADSNTPEAKATDPDASPEAADSSPETTDSSRGTPDSSQGTTDSSHGANPSVDTGAGDAAPADGDDSTLGDRPSAAKPPAPAADDGAEPTIADDGVATWFLNTNNGFVVVVRDILSSVAAVAAIGLLLFAISGIWPPLVAVESGSMEPHMQKGDLVFIVDEKRYAADAAIDGTGVATTSAAASAGGYSKFGTYGDVIVYEPFGRTQSTPIIHRARFHVEKGENWIDRADPEYLGNVDSCREVPRDMCPAPYDGFITKGDANPTYDQIGDQSTIVKSEWIRGKAAVRIPLLGWIRLEFAKLAATGFTNVGGLEFATMRLGAFGLAAAFGAVAVRV